MRRRTEVLDWGIEGIVRSLRTIRRYPGFAAGVVLTLALGVGANAAMFGILDRLLFQPPSHVVDHESVFRVMLERTWSGERSRQASLSFPDYLDLEAAGGFASVAAWSGPSELTLGRGEEATRVKVARATHGLFPLLGVRPALGRFYRADEDRSGAPATAVVSHEFWTRALGGDPEALGRELVVAGDPYTVVGVAPAGFTGVDLSPVDVWLPLETSATFQYGSDDFRENRGWWWLNTVARLAPGASVEAAAAEATSLHRNGRREEIERERYPYPADATIALDPLILARGPEASADSKVARWLGGVSLIVLLIACVNVANLLLARATRRRREVAVRLALGVGRARLVAQAVLESVVLALIAGAVALALAAWGGAAIRTVLLPGVHFPGGTVSPRLIAFTLAAAALAGVVAGVGPALQGARADLAGDLAMGAGQSSIRRSRTRGLLTVLQASLSVVLLVGAGLFVRSVSEVRSLDLGLDVDRLLLAQIEFESGNLAPGVSTDGLPPVSEAQVRNQIYRTAIERLREVPGVEGVAGTSSPFQWAFATSLKVAGWDSLPRLPGGGPYFHDVTPGYLGAVGLRILQGRGLEESDGPGDEKVAVVSETMARALWPGEDPLGKLLLVDEEETPFTVVGVTEDASRGRLREEAHMAFYMPIAQRPERRINALYVRWSGGGGAAAALTPQVGAVLRSVSPGVRYGYVRPLSDILDPQARSWTLGATLFTVFGILALLVAAVGLYSVLAFDVAQRTRELGIRTALGAEKRRLLRTVVGGGVRLAAAGVVLGIGAALVAGPRVEELLFDVSPRDPAVLSAVALALLVVSLAASLVPGLRATRVDPMTALRSE